VDEGERRRAVAHRLERIIKKKGTDYQEKVRKKGWKMIEIQMAEYISFF